jgi:hypothetical protein
MRQQLAALSLALLLAVSPARSQIVLPSGGSGGGGGSGTVTSIATGCQATGGTITTTGTISTQETISSQTGSNYPFVTGNCGQLVNLNNAGAQTPTIPVAGSAGFPAGWYVDICNIGAGAQTLTPATGTVGGAATRVFAAGSASAPVCARLISDGVSNYVVVFPPGSAASGLTVGTTTITSGSTTNIEYNNAGVLGEYTISGTGTVVAMTASPTFTGTVGAAAITATGIIRTSSAGSAAAPSLVVGNSTTGCYSVSTTGLGCSVNGSVKFDYGINSSSAFTVYEAIITSGSTITGTGAGGIALVTSSQAGGTAGGMVGLTAGGNTQVSGTAAGGSVAIAAGNASGAGSTGNGGNVVITAGTSVGGTAGTIQMVNVASDTALTDNTLCMNTTSHIVYTGSGTLGTCLGTSSSIRFKPDYTLIADGLRVMDALDPGLYHYAPGIEDSGKKLNAGFTAERYAEVLPQFTRYDSEGRPNGLDMLAAFPYAVRAIQQLDAKKADREELEALRERVYELEHSGSHGATIDGGAFMDCLNRNGCVTTTNDAGGLQ